MMAEQFYTVASDSETAGDDKPQSAFPELSVGIDLGTMQCSIAVWNGAGVEVLRNRRNEKLLRSYVSFRDEIPSGGLTDELSHDEHEVLSGGTVFNMKRLVGRVDTDPVVHASKTLPFMVQTLDIGVRPFVAALIDNVWRSTTPEEVLAVYLVELKAMAEARLRRTIRNTVLTIPVSFSRFQLTRIERACAMAGLRTLRLMPEPTSAALLYAQQQLTAQENMSSSGIEKIALIFNMGAGYCDVAVSATAGGVSQIKALSGCAVGGEDMLQNVLRHLVPDLDSYSANRTKESITRLGLLRVAAQDAIHELSFRTNALIDVDLGDGRKIRRTLDRSEFEKVNIDVIEKCGKLVVQSLQDAKLVAEDVSDVVLVGGCSNIPRIRSLVLRLCKKEVAYEGIDPFEASVRGAALEGAIASGVTDPSGSLDLLTIQATPMSVGVCVDGLNFEPILSRNSTVPANRSAVFTTAHDNQSEVLVSVYEGEARLVADNHLLGYFKIIGIPPAPKGTVDIVVSMDVDASNVLRATAGHVAPQDHEQHEAPPLIEVRMPMLDDGHGWCGQALAKMYGSSLDLAHKLVLLIVCCLVHGDLVYPYVESCLPFLFPL